MKNLKGLRNKKISAWSQMNDVKQKRRILTGWSTQYTF